MLDFSLVRKNQMTLGQLVAELTVDDLRDPTHEMIDYQLALIADCDDADVTFMPVDSVADDKYAADAAEANEPEVDIPAEIARREDRLKAITEARERIDAIRADGLPKLSLGAGPTWQNLDGAHTHGNSVGLTLTLPIFSGFATTYAVRKAEAQAEAVSAQREDLRLQVALDVWTAYQNLTTATQTVRTTADLLASAEQSERVALGRYKAGVGNILDVLNAQSALASARLQRIQSLLDWHVSRATLARAVGALDNRLLLPPGERPAP